MREVHYIWTSSSLVSELNLPEREKVSSSQSFAPQPIGPCVDFQLPEFTIMVMLARKSCKLMTMNPEITKLEKIWVNCYLSYNRLLRCRFYWKTLLVGLGFRVFMLNQKRFGCIRQNTISLCGFLYLITKLGWVSTPFSISLQPRCHSSPIHQLWWSW